MAVVCERVRPSADGAEVDTKVQVEGRTVLEPCRLTTTMASLPYLRHVAADFLKPRAFRVGARDRRGRLLFSDATVCT